MKLSIGTDYSKLACELNVSPKMTCSAQVDCGDYDLPTIGYAACRYLRRNAVAREKYVTMSYRMRFATGRNRRAQRRCLVVPAKLLELPGETASIAMTVDPFGITIENVSIFETRKTDRVLMH